MHDESTKTYPAFPYLGDVLVNLFTRSGGLDRAVVQRLLVAGVDDLRELAVRFDNGEKNLVLMPA